jgi:hypothetical protein
MREKGVMNEEGGKIRRKGGREGGRKGGRNENSV